MDILIAVSVAVSVVSLVISLRTQRRFSTITGAVFGPGVMSAFEADIRGQQLELKRAAMRYGMDGHVPPRNMHEAERILSDDKALMKIIEANARKR